MLRCLCGPPSIPLSFNLAAVLPRRNAYCVNCGTEGVDTPTPSIHRLPRGLPGYLILFAPHAFAPQRQLQSRKPPSPLVFLPISTHFTATPVIPLPLLHSSPPSFLDAVPPQLSPGIFTPNLIERRLRTPYAQSFRTTLAPTYYRGCWHVVSRGFLLWYRHFLRPIGQRFTSRNLLPSRGVAGSGFRPLPNIPHCCLP